MNVRAELARILITVKASPQPSAKYGDTVCVAGIRIDGGRAEWIRLYPVPFRWMDGDHQFHKYDLIDVEIRRAKGDSRPESYRPDIDTVHVVGHRDGWSRRQQYFEQLPRTSTCALREESLKRHDAPSLGMVPVARLHDIQFEPHPGWSETEKTKIAASLQLAPLSLFTESNSAPAPLKAPRFKVKYRYYCTAPNCPRHDGQILDWELTALQNRSRVSDQDLKAIIRERFVDRMFAATRETSFFMGNFEDPRKRHGYSVLGIHYPPTGISSRVGLFELDAD